MYQQIIKDELTKIGLAGKYDPRHIEAYMRIGNDCLDGISRRQFVQEMKVCMQCVDGDGQKNAEGLALSFGL